MTLRAEAAVLLLALVMLVPACGESDVIQHGPDDLADGRITGFVSPIDIPVAEAILFNGGIEVARTAFAEGVFALDGIAPGSYRLEVRAFGYQTNDAARDIAVEPGATTDLGRVIMIGVADGSPQTPFVEGIVLDDAAGVAVAAVSVKAQCTDGVCTVQQAVTDGDGAFRVPVATLLETRIAFSAPGYRQGAVTVPPIPRGETRHITARLVPLLPARL